MASPWDVCQTHYKYLFQPNLLQGKVAFITGGGSGIGFTITEILMRHGCNVAIGSRNMERVREASKRLEDGTGRKCLALQMDVRKPREIIAAVDKTLEEYGKLDILVNNAAGNFKCPLSEMSYNAFKTVMEIDTLGTFNVSKTVYDRCMKEKGGVIVNISAVLHLATRLFQTHAATAKAAIGGVIVNISALFVRGDVLQAHAGTAKAAIDNLTRHMAVEWGPQKIRVVGVAPGPIAETEGMRKLAGVTGSIETVGQVPSIPLGRLGSKLEIAHAVVYVASDIASYVTGHTLVSDGGSWMTDNNSMDESLKQLHRLRAKQKAKM